MNFGVQVNVGAHAFVLPFETKLVEWSVDELQELFMALLASDIESVRAQRNRLRPLFHHEDENLSVTVVPSNEGSVVSLSFGLKVEPSGEIGYVYEATEVPPSLRAHVGGGTYEVGASYPNSESLVAICHEVAVGQIDSFCTLRLEAFDAQRPGIRRRLVSIFCPSGALVFGALCDLAGSDSLDSILKKISRRSDSSEDGGTP
jgi:hypothetical protein